MRKSFVSIPVEVDSEELSDRVAAEAHFCGAAGLEERGSRLLIYAPAKRADAVLKAEPPADAARISLVLVNRVGVVLWRNSYRGTPEAVADRLLHDLEAAIGERDDPGRR